MIRLPTNVDGPVAVDTETSGLHCDDAARLSVVSLAWRSKKGELRTAVYPFDQGPVTPLGAKGDLPPRYKGEGMLDAAPNLDPDDFVYLCDWLTERELVWHNAKFDLHMFDAGLRDRGDWGFDLSWNTIWDTIVVAPLHRKLASVALKSISADLWGVQETQTQLKIKEWLAKNGKRYDLVPWDLMEPYAGQDAALTLRLFEYQQQLIEEGIIEYRLADREIDVMLALFRMEQRGLPVDVPGLLVEQAKLGDMIDVAYAELAQAMDLPKSATITENTMRRFWFDPSGLGLAPLDLTPGGKPKVTLAVVRALVARGTKGAAEWQRLAALNTSYQMWYGTWANKAGADGRLRTTFRQTKLVDDAGAAAGGTVSGRLAVERVNLQAIPHDYQIPEGLRPLRRFIRPEPGYELWEVDLSQAEMRVAAGIAKCQPLIDAFARGEDAHDATARLIFHVDDTMPLWKKYRNIAKRLNFGMLYGAGVERLVAEIKLHTGIETDRHEVLDWLDTYRSTFPELSRMSRRAMAQVEQSHYLPLAGGRRRWFRWDEPSHKAMNALIQGGVAELMKVAMVEFEVAHPGHLILQIHDSLVLHSPVEEAEAVAKGAADILCSTFENAFGLPFVCDAKVWEV